MFLANLVLLIAVLSVFVLTGCDRIAPELSGIKDTVTIDCGTKFNLDDYLSDNMKITDENDDGVKDYRLKDMEYELSVSDELRDGNNPCFVSAKFLNTISNYCFE